MFFNTINTLIEHHQFASANVQIAKDSKGLYAIVNLAVNTDNVTDETLLQACATPFVIRDSGNGFDVSADAVIQQLYESIVNVDTLDVSNAVNAVDTANKQSKTAKTAKKNATKSTANATTTPSPTNASDLFADTNSL